MSGHPELTLTLTPLRTARPRLPSLATPQAFKPLALLLTCVRAVHRRGVRSAVHVPCVHVTTELVKSTELMR